LDNKSKKSWCPHRFSHKKTEGILRLERRTNHRSRRKMLKAHEGEKIKGMALFKVQDRRKKD